MRSVLWTVCVLAFVAFGSAARAASVADFLDYSMPGLPGRLYIPPEASIPLEDRPFILFMHGAGEVGNNNLSQINFNIDNLLDAAKQRGAFVYAPQANGSWGDTTRTNNVMAMIDQALTSYNIDPDRLYVTGLSMGGGGTWDMLNRFEDRFAAGLPICGVSPSGTFTPSNLVGTPTWAFHARNDTTVSVTTSRTVVNQIVGAASQGLLNLPATSEPFSTVLYSNDQVGIKYTEWPDGEHPIWYRVYDTPEVYDWMFSQTLDPAAPISPATTAQVIVNSTGPFYPIGDQDGYVIANMTGFAAVGTIDLADALVSATNATTLGLLANSFTQFGDSVPLVRLGARPVEGQVFSSIGAPLASTDSLAGKSIYLVIGDGIDIQNSNSLFVYKSNELFTAGPSNFVTTIQIGSGMSEDQILLGSHGTVFVNQLGGTRAGIVAAAVDIPEPTTGVVGIMGIVAFLLARRQGAPRDRE
jgi:predicted esterase